MDVVDCISCRSWRSANVLFFKICHLRGNDERKQKKGASRAFGSAAGALLQVGAGVRIVITLWCWLMHVGAGVPVDHLVDTDRGREDDMAGMRSGANCPTASVRNP